MTGQQKMDEYQCGLANPVLIAVADGLFACASIDGEIVLFDDGGRQERLQVVCRPGEQLSSMSFGGGVRYLYCCTEFELIGGPRSACVVWRYCLSEGKWDRFVDTSMTPDIDWYRGYVDVVSLGSDRMVLSRKDVWGLIICDLHCQVLSKLYYTYEYLCRDVSDAMVFAVCPLGFPTIVSVDCSVANKVSVCKEAVEIPDDMPVRIEVSECGTYYAVCDLRYGICLWSLAAGVLSKAFCDNTISSGASKGYGPGIVMMAEKLFYVRAEHELWCWDYVQNERRQVVRGAGVAISEVAKLGSDRLIVLYIDGAVAIYDVPEARENRAEVRSSRDWLDSSERVSTVDLCEPIRVWWD